MIEPAENSAEAFIAITGMAGRFPGARNISEFWRNLREGVESISFMSTEQLLAAGVTRAELENPDYVRAAAILDEIDLFDATFFGFSPRDAAIMDPQHRLFLECAWEALENAGWSSDQFSGRIGVYAGSGMNSYLIHNLLNNPELVASTGLFVLKQTGNDKDVLATRVSYQLNLTGPSLSVQTACSTSLVATHLACQSLLNQECDMALAGGVTIEVPHGIGYVYREGEILSRDGHCRAFDADSSGTIFGSGVGIVVLRRLEDALRDGDFVHAVIRGTAINNDGARKVGYLAPSVAGQSDAIVEALAVAGVEADSISYVECHGTGTTVGDPIEIKALTNAFRESTDRKGFCAVGSVKTNIGHLDAAAGVAGLIKTVLALKNQQLPPTLNLSNPNPLIDFDASPFYPNSKLRNWPAGDRPRRGSVTSLGIGGTNAHVVLEEAPVSAPSEAARPFQLLTLSAKTPSALDATVRNIAGYLADNPGKLADIAYTCHLGRKEFSHRQAIVGSEIGDAIDAIRRRDPKRMISSSAGRERPVMFLFSGQGSQYVQMGADIYQSESEFRSVVDFCADFLEPLIGLDLRTILVAADREAEQAARLLNETWLTQPALFVIEYALAKLWLNWGIQPKAMIGHSIGEFVAACVAGVFSLETALRLVAERGRLMQSMPSGAMTAVLLAEKEIITFLGNGLSLAAVNSEDQCVVSGLDTSLGDLEIALSAKGVTYHRLRVSHAFHSSMMDPILKNFEEFVRDFELEPPRIPYVSCVTGTWITESEATSPSYWARQLREPVRFSRGVGELLEEPDGLLLEIGPGNTLSALTEQHNSFSDTHEVVSSMRVRTEAVSDAETLTRALAKLWAVGKRIDWRAFHSHEKRQRLPLPTYPFERQRFWIDPVSRDRGLDCKPDDLQQRGKDESIRLFRHTWTRTGLGADPDSRAIGPWLIFQDSEGLGTHIAASLRGSGEQCIVVTPGVSFERISNDEFQISAGNPADYITLISILTSERRLPRSIIHLWSVTGSNSLGQPLDDLPEVETLSFYSLLYLSQALGAVDEEAPIQIAIVTNGVFQVANEPVLHFERALALGPCGVIPKEFPNLSCRTIDVEGADRSASANGHVAEALREARNQILSELRSGANDSPVAYRNGRRWTRTFIAAETGAKDKSIALRDGGVYLITGGLGAIGLVLAESIARRCRSRFVLTGRSIFPPRGEWDEWLGSHGDSDPVAQKIRTIRSIETLDSEVLVVSADVADLEDMRGAIAQAQARFGAITGVIHAAGVLDDAPILQKDAPSAALVLAPKVRGTMVLKLLFASQPLEFLILSSSISSTIAPAGQIDYVAANAFLEAFADAAAMPETCRTIAIQWPRWREVGMAADPVKNPDRQSDRILPQQPDSDRSDIEYVTKLSLERDWIVGEHRLKSGVGLFPGTGYIEMVRALVVARLGQKSVRIQDLTINAPLKVDPAIEQPLGILLRKEKEEYRLSITTISHNSRANWIECAKGRVNVAQPAPAAVLNIRRIQRRCNRRELKFDLVKQNQTQERHIDFGPRWRNLKRIWVGRGEALSEVELAERFAADLIDHPVHPAILDMASGAALFLIDGYGEIEFLYVPVSYGSITLRGQLPAKCYGHIRAKKGADRDSRMAAFDITILDERGHALLDIEDLSFLQVRDPAILDRDGMGAAPAAFPPTKWKSLLAPDEVPGINPDSISKAQGTQAFEAVLANALTSKIIVFPSDLVAFLEKNRPTRAKRKGRPSISAGQVPPRDEIEATLAGWWEELLGVQGVSTKESFFQLGGDSLTAARFFAKLNKKYGIKLSLATMFAAPTIEKLARIIRDDDRPPSYSSLVPIQPQGTKAPLYVVHGRGGEVLLYSDLAKHLQSDQPVYGIQSPTLGDSKRGLLRLEDLAAHYVEEIRSIQPQGPYFLLGHSLGGVVGFEIAQQLRIAGHEVGLLGMLDTWEIGYISRLQREQTFLSASRKRSEHWLDHLHRTLLGPRRLAYINEKLAGRLRWVKFDSKQRALGFVYTFFRKTGLRLPRILERPEDINDFVYGRYQPRPYPGRVVVFRAEKGVAATDSRYSYALGWEDLAEAGTEVYEVPGTHTGLLQEPNVRVLAEKVTACMITHPHPL